MPKTEIHIVNEIERNLAARCFTVAREVANFHRSADIAAIGPKGDVWVIECKISNMKQAVNQLLVQKESADMVFIGTPHRNMKNSTRNMIAHEGIGLIFTKKDGTVEILPHNSVNHPWAPARELLISRIMSK